MEELNIMKFCPNCNNILLPHNKKLFCKACMEEFDIDTEQLEEYKIIKNIKHDEKELTPIIIRNNRSAEKISEEDRKAHEELFINNDISED